MWDKITYAFLSANGWTVEVWEWISSFIPQFNRHVITNSCRGWSGAPGIQISEVITHDMPNITLVLSKWNVKSHKPTQDGVVYK